MSNYICPECEEPVENKAPTTISPDAGPKRDWRHKRGKDPLCPIVGRRGYEPAKPVREGRRG